MTLALSHQAEKESRAGLTSKRANWYDLGSTAPLVVVVDDIAHVSPTAAVDDPAATVKRQLIAREGDRQTDRHRDIETKRQTDRQTD